MSQQEAYVETIEGRCPECGQQNPGHVTVLQPAGVYAWTCPIPTCEAVEDPHQMWTRPRDPEAVTAPEFDPCPECDGRLRVNDGLYARCVDCSGLFPRVDVEPEADR